VAAAGFEARTIELSEGTRVLVRPIVPEDEPLLHEAVAAMSERTVYFRFFTPLKRIVGRFGASPCCRRLQRPFRTGRTITKPAGRERIVGVASTTAFQHRCRRDRGRGDRRVSAPRPGWRAHGHTGQGRARARIKTFTLIVLPENQQMLGLLRRWAGSTARSSRAASTTSASSCPRNRFARR